MAVIKIEKTKKSGDKKLPEGRKFQAYDVAGFDDDGKPISDKEPCYEAEVIDGELVTAHYEE